MTLLRFSQVLTLMALCVVSLSTGCRADRFAARNAAPDVAGPSTHDLTYMGRAYNLYVPPSAAQGKTPLLVVLHGAYGNADHIESHLGMDPVADKYGFKVAYLNGTAKRERGKMRFWNTAGGCCGPAEDKNIDDIGFIDRFVEMMIQTQNVDPNRVFMMGHSNGSMMTYSYACSTGHVRAIVAVSGPLLLKNCPRGKGLRVLHIHGQADENVPIQGGYSKRAMTGQDEFTSLDYTEKTLEGAGASFKLMLLPGIGHKMTEIRQAIDLPDVAARFLLGVQ